MQARLPLWVGGGGEKVTLRIVAAHADGWNVPFVMPEQYAHKVAGARSDHCEAVGRDPGEIERSVNLALAWKRRRPRGAVRRDCERGAAERAHRARVQQVIDRIGEYADAGLRTR